MKSIKVGANAKINLSLNIDGIRFDGYHLISSVMQSINLKNHLYIEKSNSFSFACNDKALPKDDKNTAVMAAKLFFKELSMPPLVFLELNKIIPYGAGMGSASADAAAALWGLNLLYDKPFGDNKLKELGLQVGADVPFALTGGTKLVTGIGEILNELPQLPHCWFLITSPDYKVSTALAYSELDKKGITQDGSQLELIEGLKSKDLTTAAKNIGNVFFKVSNYEKNEEYKEEFLKLGALNATLTGSGSSVYGIFDDYEKACYAKSQLKSTYLCEPQENSLEIE